MKFTLLFPSILALVSAGPHHERASIPSWHPAGPNDFRGPCPMMNTLANHNFLPHDGRNITKENAISALGKGLNFHPSLAALMFEQAIVANPEPNATFFTLEMLNVHGVLEHDASLSRKDAFFGNNHIFSPSIFAQTQRYWTAPTLTPNMLASSKLARQVESKAFNPKYTFTASVENFSLGEVAAPIIAFGDMAKGTVSRRLVKYFFENERLPFELGWSQKKDAVTLENILGVTGIIAKAATLITGSEEGSEHAVGRRDLHSGSVV